MTAIDVTLAGGAWVVVPALPLLRQRIDAAVGAALETLAPVPDLLRIGNT